MANRLNPGLTVTNTTDQADIHPELHNYLSESVISQHENVLDHGADNTGVADSATAITAAITALGASGGTVYFPAGSYSIGSTIDVPSGVTILGSGKYSTKLMHTSAHTGFMFRTVAGAMGTNFYGQNFGQRFSNFEIRDRNSANTPTLQGSGRSETHHGILIEDSDWGSMDHLSIRDLKGKAVDMDDVVREWNMMYSIIHNCGDGASSLPAVRIYTSTGDATNTIFFKGVRVYFSNGIAVNVDGAQNGLRYMMFTDCQFEGGGNGTGVNYGTPHPYDIFYVGRCESIDFKGSNFSNPGAGKFCLNLNGYSGYNLNHCSLNDVHFNGNSSGGGIRLNYVDAITLTSCLFTSSTATEYDLYFESVSGIAEVDGSVVYSPNPIGGSYEGHIRGRYTPISVFDYRDRLFTFDGGGVRFAFTDGKPPENLNLGFATPNGVLAYDFTNNLYWMRHTGQWMPMTGQVLYSIGEEGFAEGTTERTILSYTVPAGAVYSGGGLELAAYGYFQGATSASVIIRLKLNGSTVIQDTTASMTGGSVYPWSISGHIRNIGDTAVNRCHLNVLVNSSGTATTGRGDIGTDETTSVGILQASTTADFSSTVTVALTIQPNSNKEVIRSSAFIRTE